MWLAFLYILISTAQWVARISAATPAALAGPHAASIAGRQHIEQGVPTSSRGTFVIIDLDLEDPQMDTGGPIVRAHSAIHLGPTATDGQFRTEIADDRKHALVIRGRDYTIANNQRPIGLKPPSPDMIRKVFYLGPTAKTNDDMIDSKTGKGIVWDAWKGDTTYDRNSNDCNQLTRQIIERMEIDPSPQYNQALEAFNSLVDEARENFDEETWFEQHVGTVARETIVQWGGPEPNAQQLWRASGSGDLTPLPGTMAVDDLFADETLPVQTASDPLSDRVPTSLSPMLTSDESGQAPLCARDLYSRCVADKIDPSMSVTRVRVNNVLAQVIVVAEDVVRAASGALLLAAPLFIILDFLNGNVIGGAFGVVSLALGVVALALAATPIGWAIAGLAALFAILPTFFTATPSGPSINDAVQIIQWAMFGDPNHTGNEKCRAQGNPNCTALYGPGVLSASFGWQNNYDPVVFLIQFNKGYAMSIPDMAKNFYIIKDGGAQTDAGQIATISCRQDPCTRWGCPGRGMCKRPVFRLNRELINLPKLHQTAAQVYERMIPKPGGDCKLVSDVSNTIYPAFNLTVTNAPVAIACNLSASLNLNGVAVPLQGLDTNNQSAALESPSNASTDGQSHSVAVPPATGFAAVLNSSNSACLSGPGGSACLPPGTYKSQSGSLGFDSSQANALAMPAGASISFVVLVSGPRLMRYTLQPVNYTQSLTANDGTHFQNSMLALSKQQSYTLYSVFHVNILTPTPPLLCLYTQAQYQGDVACYGPGGGNLTGAITTSAQSLKLYGGATAWIFGEAYGDIGGERVAESIPDLSVEVLGTSQSFNRMIKALWVLEQ